MEPELEWIRRTLRFEQELMRGKRENSLDRDIEERPDYWYRRFRENEQIEEVENITTTEMAVKDDQIEKTKNDLSHEADYKLSKIEQESFELLQPNNQTVVTPEKIEPLKKRYPLENNIKRYINPNHEIKLKIANRMIHHGMGASLPSESLHNTIAQPSSSSSLLSSNEEKPFDEVLSPDNSLSTINSKFHKLPNFNLFKRDNLDRQQQQQQWTMNNRKLLQLNNDEDYYNVDEIVRDKRYGNSKDTLHTYETAKQFFNDLMNRRPKLIVEATKLKENDLILRSIGKDIIDNNEDGKVEKKEENCEESNTVTDKNDNTMDKDETTTEKKEPELEEHPITTVIPLLQPPLPPLRTPTTLPKNSNQTFDSHANRINIKLEININNVTEIPVQSNKSDAMKKRKIILKRELRNHHRQRQHRRTNNSGPEISMNDLENGHLPNQLVRAVFQLVKTDENLRRFIQPNLNLSSVSGYNEAKLLEGTKSKVNRCRLHYRTFSHFILF